MTQSEEEDKVERKVREEEGGAEEDSLSFTRVIIKSSHVDTLTH